MRTITITFTGEQSLSLTQIAMLALNLGDQPVIFTYEQQQVIRRAGLAWREAVESGVSSPVTASEAGRRGGSSRSDAKVQAARANATRPRPNRRKKKDSAGENNACN